MWLLAFGCDMNKVSLSKLASKGTKDIFLNSKAFSLYGKSKVISWIKNANKKELEFIFGCKLL